MGILLLSWILAGQEERGPGVAEKADGREAPVVRFRAGGEVEVLDNVLRLSEREVEQVEAGSRPDKFRIRTPHDVVYSPWVETTLSMELFGLPATVGLKAAVHLYHTNPVLDTQELRFFARLRPFELEYTLLPSVYRREYKDLVTDQFASAFYTEHEIELAARFAFFEERLTVRPKVGIEIRDYDEPFDFRDEFHRALGAQAKVRITEILDVFLEYRFDDADSSAFPTEPDTSRIEHRIEPGVAVRALPGLRLEARFRYAAQEYTTTNSPFVDPGHRDRTDTEQRILLAARWEVSETVSIDAGYRHTLVRSDRPHDAGATDEETGWERNEGSLGVTFRF